MSKINLFFILFGCTIFLPDPFTAAWLHAGFFHEKKTASRLMAVPSEFSVLAEGTQGQALFCVAPIFVQNGNCSPFLKLTPTPRQMPRDVTNISEDWADFCQCQEFWCHFLSFVFSEKWPFWLWEGALSLSKSPLKVKRDIFTWKWMR